MRFGLRSLEMTAPQEMFRPSGSEADDKAVWKFVQGVCTKETWKPPASVHFRDTHVNKLSLTGFRLRSKLRRGKRVAGRAVAWSAGGGTPKLVLPSNYSPRVPCVIKKKAARFVPGCAGASARNSCTIGLVLRAGQA